MLPLQIIRVPPSKINFISLGLGLLTAAWLAGVL